MFRLQERVQMSPVEFYGEALLVLDFHYDFHLFTCTSIETSAKYNM